MKIFNGNGCATYEGGVEGQGEGAVFRNVTSTTSDSLLIFWWSLSQYLRKHGKSNKSENMLLGLSKI